MEDWIRFKKDAKIVVLDCETYNLNLHFSVNRPWNVAVLKVLGDNIIEEHNLFIKWRDCQFSIGDGAKFVTHFNEQEFERKAIDPKTAFERFWPLLIWSDHIIGHNLLRFDLYLLRGYAEYMGVDWKFILSKIIDTKSLIQGIKLNRPYKPGIDDFLEYQYRMANDHTKGIKTSLSVVSKEFGIIHDYDTLHDGLSDIKLNLKFWNQLKNRIEL